MRVFASLAVMFIVAACSSSSTGGSSGASGGPADAATEAAPGIPDATAEGGTDGAPPPSACFVLPTSAKKQGAGCTGTSGTFTQITYDSGAGTYDESCNGPPPYKDQAEFDANEGTSSAAGVVITSHEDYVVTATCASGSIDYQASGSAKTTIVFLWTKVP